ncbi:MAG: ATP synthase subunit I [Pseudomonadota bacterium]|nr:ATP synthase subunit I [Pseudomonadota bacterium]
MLKVALPRPSFDAVCRDEGRSSPVRGQGQWDESESDELPFRRLSRVEAEALRKSQPALSPWRVVAAQLVLGALIGAVAWAISGELAAVSAWYGAAVVVVPGALMARGATSPLSTLSPVVSAVSMLGWGFVKIAVSVAMLVLATRIVPGLVWPALLVSMVICLQSYWFALLWRGRAASGTNNAR